MNFFFCIFSRIYIILLLFLFFFQKTVTFKVLDMRFITSRVTKQMFYKIALYIEDD